ncbi:WRC domain [Dillenia turbinata]|uniref:WRC domain n=1 Tax=Dillenia turbinata TaxID=194707 RepID=A0AAN8UML6_9MAGN
MDYQRPSSGNGEDNVGIPEDLRCKRSDGKQWRCSAMSMPDKTVCEKHYIQAKKRAANSALRQSMKRANKKSLGETDVYLESKSDEYDVPLLNSKVEDYPAPLPGKKYKDKVSKCRMRCSPDSPPLRNLSTRTSKFNDVAPREVAEFEESWRSYRTPYSSAMEASRNRSQNDSTPEEDQSDDITNSSDSSDDNGGQTCHQCRRNDRGTVIWCLRCDRRGYCSNCISTRYSGIPLEELQRACPACRGTCNCKVCLRGDNLIKARIREIPVHRKLQYLHSLLSSVLPVVKQIHHEQCNEVELEKRLRGAEMDLVRIKLNADEQMCCNMCRTPIIDYHRHCSNCLHDLCLKCCQDLRERSGISMKGEPVANKTAKRRLDVLDKFPDWKANTDGSIPCPPKVYGGCAFRSLSLKRIFKMNWVAKLVKNLEEMVSGCKVRDNGNAQKPAPRDLNLCQTAHREANNDNYLYFPPSKDIKNEGIDEFRKHWARGEPVIVKEACDNVSISSWDPMAIWRGIQEITDEKLKDDCRTVKAINYLNGSEVDVDLHEFIRGYSEGRLHENGLPELLKLKDWPSPSACEEFLMYQKPEFISKLPLLEFIHSKWGLLNVAAKLPHYSLQNDAGPKIFMSYGMHEELGRGNAVTNLHCSMRDMVYLLLHTSECKPKGSQKVHEAEAKEPFEDAQESSIEKGRPFDLSLDSNGTLGGHGINLDINKDETMEDQANGPPHGFAAETVNHDYPMRESEDFSEKTHASVLWDIFRRHDVPKLIEYLKVQREEFVKRGGLNKESAMHILYDKAVYLSSSDKRKLKEEFGVEPWSFQQLLGQAVFIPAGCPFQMRNLQSTVQLELDFLSPESLGESVRLAEEIRCLPNDHEVKVETLEVGKISLYAASSSIKEVHKLVLDPKLGLELGFGDPNLTAMVSENMEKMTKLRQIACV